MVELILKVFDFNLDEVELSDEQVDNLTAEEIQQNDWRVVVMTTSASDTITDKDREKIKHQVCSQFKGIVHMDKLDTKYFGKNTYECAAFYYPKSDSSPAGSRFVLG
tara:strand:- start:2423 stop:2743 length:321 start_codon:yes stop_codon:yes gene_type:complete